MDNVDQWNTLYAGVLAVGGVIGYLKAGSLPSLCSGVGSGLLVYGFTNYHIQYKTVVVCGISGLLGYMMAQRFHVSQKMMPAGITAAASLITLALNLYKMSQTGSIH